MLNSSIKFRSTLKSFHQLLELQPQHLLQAQKIKANDLKPMKTSLPGRFPVKHLEIHGAAQT